MGWDVEPRAYRFSSQQNRDNAESRVFRTHSGIGGAWLFRVRDDVHDQIPVILDEEIKAPILVDAGLPEAPALVVFLGAERWMVEILEQKQRLLIERTFDLLGSLGVVPLEVGRAEKFHHAERLVFLRFNFLASSWSEAMNSLWVAKGPWTLPASISARPSASWASTMRRCSGVYSSSAGGSLG